MHPRTTSSERGAPGIPRARECDEGSASLEFLTAGMILLVPIVYLVIALAVVQSSALGAQAAARHVARTIATATDATAADAGARTVLAAIAEEYGMDAASLSVAVECRGTGACPRPSAVVTVTVRGEASLPLIPPVLGLESLATVPIEASAVQRMSRTWGSS
ncbi:hypothetical protein [Microbacterium sp. cf332]|uniref:hypothetical protein n=1 Tax=Microbacterium sp. cf332 TaxID=1761804 RepID=UPI000885BF95|nr:hypothetical protein [Microbacterium sp. cf332]SDQ13488.1 hypothetical protein SAMN04487847_0531 [Microbacterium sp. cf332]